MTAPLVLGVSPYHLTGPSPAAMAALLFADYAVTIVPTPPGEPDRNRARRAAETVPRFVELVDRWRWSVPLWLEGVLRADHAGEDPSQHVHEMVRAIETRDDLEPLRRFLHPDRDADDRVWLDAVASDLLRGGPDPGLAVPVTAALDVFCAESSLTAVRCDPTSVAERAEAKLADRIARVAAPGFIECSAERLLEARDLLAPELGALRAGLAASAPQADLRAAADAYARAFEAHRERLHRVEDEADPRVRSAIFSLEFARLPADAALQSSVLAAVATGAARASRRPPEPPNGTPAPGAPLSAVFVRVVGRPAAVA
ncbi:MAG: hypothetical protein DHS20C14_22820 [Phycisphaeraceae bacterium]|nr:MAG: hypothetical protein DHS20C14_22820 [Phycisphaeraceae bacterium]